MYKRIISIVIIIILLLTSWIPSVSCALQSKEITNEKTKQVFLLFSDNEINQNILSTFLSFFLQLKQKNNILMELIEKIIKEQQKSIDILEFLNNHPILENKIKEQYPLLYFILKSTSGHLDLKDFHLFTKYRLLRTIILFIIIQEISDHTRTNTQNELHLPDAAKWMRDHPLLALELSLLLLMLLIKISDTTTEEENPDMIEENKPPHANAGGPYNEQVGMLITLSAEKSYDEDGIIVTFDWDFGDGTKDTGKIVSHRYNKTGTFIVSLMVVDDKGKSSTDTSVITITSDNGIITGSNDNYSVFWIVSGSLSIILLLGLLGLKFRRRLFE